MVAILSQVDENVQVLEAPTPQLFMGLGGAVQVFSIATPTLSGLRYGYLSPHVLFTPGFVRTVDEDEEIEETSPASAAFMRLVDSDVEVEEAPGTAVSFVRTMDEDVEVLFPNVISTMESSETWTVGGTEESVIVHAGLKSRFLFVDVGDQTDQMNHNLSSPLDLSEAEAFSVWIYAVRDLQGDPFPASHVTLRIIFVDQAGVGARFELGIVTSIIGSWSEFRMEISEVDVVGSGFDWSDVIRIEYSIRDYTGDDDLTVYLDDVNFFDEVHLAWEYGRILNEDEEIEETPSVVTFFTRTVDETEELEETPDTIRGRIIRISSNIWVMEAKEAQMSFLRILDELEEVEETNPTIAIYVRIVDEWETILEGAPIADFDFVAQPDAITLILVP